MRIKLLAGSGFLLNTIFFATYYAVAKEALNRIDPIVFTFFEMVILAPVALLIILCSWKSMTQAVIKRGVLLGSTLCLALFTIAIALKYTTATSTAFFPALNGFVAAIIAWALFREPMKGQTWLAGGVSLAGAALLIFSSSMGNLRGTLIAFLGGLFYTCYVFLCDREQKDETAAWPLFGVELLTTALWANLVALLFGDWQGVHPLVPKDIWVVIYVSTACTFVPTLISVLLQKYISPVTVSFIYILEPVLGALIANLYLQEVLPIQGYIGGGLVVVGALIHTWGGIGKPVEKGVPARRLEYPAKRGSWVSTILYPSLSCVLGAALLSHLGGFPPTAWQDVSQISQLSQDIQQGQGMYVTILLVQAGGWLVAWISVLLMGLLALYHLLQSLMQPAQPQKSVRAVVVPRTVVRPPSARVQPVRRLEKPPVQVVRELERPVGQAARRVRTTVRLPEQSTWYGEAVRMPSLESLDA
jgi:drug/metabolite transporter (DMT)-like permease